METTSSQQVPKSNHNILGDLNFDCLLYIFKYLPIADLNACSQVSTQFRAITDSFRSKAVLKSRDNCIVQLDPKFRSTFLRSLIENVGHHLQTLFLNFDFIQECDPKRTMHIVQDHCTGTLKQLSIKSWNKMELDEYKDLLLGLDLLHLERCSVNPQRRIASVLRDLLQLKTFSMVNCTHLTDDEMNEILENKKRLTKLQLVTPSVHGFHSLPNTLGILPNLQHVVLHMESTKMLDLTPLADIEDLRSLQLTNYTCLSMSTFVIFCHMFRQLFRGLSQRGRLEELVLHHCRMDDIVYSSIATIASLRHIALRKHYWADDRSIGRIAAHGNIRSIDLFDCGGITSSGVRDFVVANQGLSIVDVSWCSQMNNDVVADVYKVLHDRPRLGVPFELFLGGSNRVDVSSLPTIDTTVLRIWFDSGMKIDLRATQTVNMMLSEMEDRIRHTIMCRIGTQEFVNSSPKKDHPHKENTSTAEHKTVDLEES